MSLRRRLPEPRAEQVRRGTVVAVRASQRSPADCGGKADQQGCRSQEARQHAGFTGRVGRFAGLVFVALSLLNRLIDAATGVILRQAVSGPNDLRQVVAIASGELLMRCFGKSV